MKSKYYPSLDGLRCLAIVIVMLAHSEMPFLRSGGIGVDIFFALSGFLITSILLSEFERFGSINYYNFYARRFLRLLPCLAVVVGFVVVEKRIVMGYWPFKDLLPAIGYVMNWARILTRHDHYLLNHTWSLAIEEQFYLIWPVVVALVCIAIPTMRKRFGFFLGLAIVLAAYRSAMALMGATPGRIYFGSDTHSDGLVLGSALAFFVAMLPNGKLSDRPSRITAYVFTPIAIITLGTVMAKWRWWDAPMGMAGFTMVAVGSVVVLLDLVAGSHSLLWRFFTLTPLVWIGKISYGLYLWHLPVYQAMDDLHIAGGWKTKLAIGAPIAIVAAALSYYTIEAKFLSLKSRFTRKTKPIEKPDLPPVLAEPLVEELPDDVALGSV